MGNKFSKRRSSVDERYTKPQGLYQRKDVDHKKLRRLILDSKLAPCYPGADDMSTDLEECPICFLFYPSLNRSKCCMKEICTECFLQMKSPYSAQRTQCPFCKTPNYAVEYRGAKTMEEKGIERAEEEKVIEAKMRIRQKEMEDEERNMQREERNIDEIATSSVSQLLRHKFLNLHGFKIPSESSEEIASRNSEDLIDTPVITENDINDKGELGAEISGKNLSTDSSRNMVGHQPMNELDCRTAIHNQGSKVTCSSFTWANRAEEFDLDLEDIMMMEAIWLSIQDQSLSSGQNISALSGNGSNGGCPTSECGPDVSLTQASSISRGLPRGNSVTSGLAGAIAALAEQQVLGMDSSGAQHDDKSSQMGNTVVSQELRASSSFQKPDVSDLTFARSPSIDGSTHTRMSVEHKDEMEGSPNASKSPQQHQTAHDTQETGQELGSWIEVSLETGKTVSVHDAMEETPLFLSEWVPSHNSETVARSFSNSLPSSSSSSSEAVDAPEVESCEGFTGTRSLHKHTAVAPKGYEERMMFAMALSLAEAQNQSRIF